MVVKLNIKKNARFTVLAASLLKIHFLRGSSAVAIGK